MADSAASASGWASATHPARYGAVRRLDNALLAVFGDRYTGLHGNAARVPQLGVRLDRLRSAGPQSTGP